MVTNDFHFQVTNALVQYGHKNGLQLVREIHSRIQVIEGKFTDPSKVTKEAKAHAWQEIYEVLNKYVSGSFRRK